MEVTIDSKYLVFPVNELAKDKTVRFCLEGEEVYSIVLRLDDEDPKFWAYIDVQRFRGKRLQITAEPETPIRCVAAERMELPGVYREPRRPQVHFTTRNGWINDPNGCIYLDGVYHLFYQYNPGGVHWDNMHWGHAVSTDLIHWEEKDVALFIDKYGNAFSGSAILDERGVLGLEDGKKRQLLFYTATTHPFTQRMAVSTDGFQTIREFREEPVLPHIGGGNRDPKVVWCEEKQGYVMALYLYLNDYALLFSENLVDWKVFQVVPLEGDAECPDFFPMTGPDGERKWVFMGASDRYRIGTMSGGLFCPEGGTRALHYGNSGAYAGQSFSHLPEGRTVRICWDRWRTPAERFCGQMGIPMELTLKRYGGALYLAASPVRELQTLVWKEADFRREGEAALPGEIRLEKCPYWIRLSGSMPREAVEMTLFGCRLRLDPAANALEVGAQKAPLSVAGEGLDLQIIVDRCSMEVFADGGLAYLSSTESDACPDYGLPSLRIQSAEGWTPEALRLSALKSIWEENNLTQKEREPDNAV